MPRGIACGCICPSCSDLLIARHGSLNEWHFAHASKGVAETIEDPCEYSFFLSVRLMARQLTKKSLRFMSPEFNSHISEIDVDTGEIFREPFAVTSRRWITLGGIESEKKVGDVTVDLIGKVGDYSLAIYFAHPGRVAPPIINGLADDICGVLEISIAQIYKPMIIARRNEGSYESALRGFLEEDLSSKRWLYHPRYAEVKKMAEARLHEKIELARSKRVTKVPYRCGQCKQTWIGTMSNSKCPICDSSLFSFRGSET